MNRSTVELPLTAQEDTMRDVRRLLRAKVLKARGPAEESDGKALDDRARRDEGRRRRIDADRMERRDRSDGTPGR
ncbi:hypothetical protein OG890_03285 [Streptomyces anulatus]|uniref:hypothetical protein n=1 Tax=Streptomyces anulatus TaxID=1892 RepID=UPI00225C3C22|nr:hypothetical protein [Streptomyces anulatus]MCX4482981.1 hypothetical protein [Streptomyces anulatus]WSI75978.1 hypothetical protein OG557_03105 [Streptomyces anulatus]WSU72009.1 hypothetical protein OG499_03225 [Streptomyces anulatus]